MKILTGTVNELLNELKIETDTNTSIQVETEVKTIIEKVKTAGDQALFDFTSKFDGVGLTELRVPAADIQATCLLRRAPTSKSKYRKFPQQAKTTCFP